MPGIEKLIADRFNTKTVVFLGFGREGQASYALFRKVFPGKLLTIADRNETVRANPVIANDDNLAFITGESYLEELDLFDVIVRSPGIPVWQLLQPVEPQPGQAALAARIPREKITSQTELFLECYSRQVIGITGTKGKSTTTSLIHHIFKTDGRDALLAGNIGNPVFHYTDLISPRTKIIFELSSHQLEFLHVAPGISVFLNLFQEHLDAYRNYEAYQDAKGHIAAFQKDGDVLVFNSDDPLVVRQVAPYLDRRQSFPFTLADRAGNGSFIRDGQIWFVRDGRETPVWKIHQDRFLRGEHNLKNIMAAVNVAMVSGISMESIQDGIMTFKGLEHRLEYVGEFQKIHFYNDSIATIPEACMEAIRAIPDVDTLIAGGFDRGIDYTGLAGFLAGSSVRNLVLVGAAGKRIQEGLQGFDLEGKKIFLVNRFDDFRDIVFSVTRPGYACLLSPAAASYDEFRNFEERGRRFRELISSEVAK